MNEIALLRKHGPDAAPPTQLALSAARAQLMTEIAAASTRPRRRWVGLPGRETPRRARVLVMAAVATVAAAAVATVATLPALHSPDRPPAGVTLVAFSTPLFPLALHPVPAGLTGPFFSGGVGSFIAVYLDTHHSDVYLIVWSARPQQVDEGLARSVTVDGRPGELVVESDQHSGHASATISWQRKPGQWVSITGNGRFATEASVLALADAVVERPQEVPLQVGLAPAGWTLFAFKDNTILTLKDERSDDTMSVQRVERTDPDLLHNVMGARQVSPVRINGRDGQLVRADEMWFLQAPLPDGSAFNLQAPLVLTRDQVIAIGEQVTVRR